MKTCPICQTQVDDDTVFCTNCGAKFAGAEPAAAAPGAAYAPQSTYPVFDPYDHTAEFDSKDVSENKIFSMLGYLFGLIGIIIALLGSNSSPYAAFHIRQALKFTIVDILMLICTLLLCWTLIVPVAFVVMSIVLSVIKIICFFQICSGKAIEPAIIRSLKFLK